MKNFNFKITFKKQSIDGIFSVLFINFYFLISILILFGILIIFTLLFINIFIKGFILLIEFNLYLIQICLLYLADKFIFVLDELNIFWNTITFSLIVKLLLVICYWILVKNIIKKVLHFLIVNKKDSNFKYFYLLSFIILLFLFNFRFIYFINHFDNFYNIILSSNMPYHYFIDHTVRFNFRIDGQIIDLSVSGSFVRMLFDGFGFSTREAYIATVKTATAVFKARKELYVKEGNPLGAQLPDNDLYDFKYIRRGDGNKIHVSTFNEDDPDKKGTHCMSMVLTNKGEYSTYNRNDLPKFLKNSHNHKYEFNTFDFDREDNSGTIVKGKYYMWKVVNKNNEVVYPKYYDWVFNKSSINFPKALIKPCKCDNSILENIL